MEITINYDYGSVSVTAQHAYAYQRKPMIGLFYGPIPDEQALDHLYIEPGATVSFNEETVTVTDQNYQTIAEKIMSRIAQEEHQ